MSSGPCAAFARSVRGRGAFAQRHRITLSLFLLLGLLAASTSHAAVQLGSEVLAARGFRELQGRRVGLLTNPSGVNRKGKSTIDLLRDAPGVRLVALFGPEHGLDGKARAGDAVAGKVDPRTGLPVHSLYGATRKPTPEMLQGIDVLVYDLQDNGCRSYTYISTMGLAMEACAEAGVEFLVLDRPNPLGGLRVEGPMVEDPFRSFVSQWDVPYVYGMSCGELANMINGERWISKPCRLRVVPMTGWRRSMVWSDTDLPWIATSPNIPNSRACLGYATLGLLGELSGGSGLSIGGALNRPFQCVAAPWLDADLLSRQLKRHKLPGVEFGPFHALRDNRRYHGVELRWTGPATAPLVAVNFHMLDAIRTTAHRNLPRETAQAGRGFGLFDKACGTDRVRKALLAGRPATEIVAGWKAGEDAFRKQRAPYLIYDTPPKTSPSAKPPATAKPAPRANPGLATITVAPGDTLSKIARDHGTSVSAIKAANAGLDVDQIQPGQKLRIPTRR